MSQESSRIKSKKFLSIKRMNKFRKGNKEEPKDQVNCFTI